MNITELRRIPFDELVNRITYISNTRPDLFIAARNVTPMRESLAVMIVRTGERVYFLPDAWSTEQKAGNEVFFNTIDAELIHAGILEAPKPVKLENETNWDTRMLKLAAGEINTWSKDPSTKVSAVIFRGKHPVAMSYNGFPPGIADTDERLSNRELKYKFVQHAEANAISTCAKLGIATEGTTMAVTHHPCPTCAGQMISAGIAKVICQPPSPDFLSRWADDVNLAKQLFKEAGVELVIIDLED